MLLVSEVVFNSFKDNAYAKVKIRRFLQGTWSILHGFNWGFESVWFQILLTYLSSIV